MSGVTREIRNQIFEAATPIQQYLYGSSESGNKLFAVAQKFDLTSPDKYKLFAVTVGDIILGFYRIEDTVPLLQQELQLSPRAAALLGADVLDFLAPLSDPNWQPPTETQIEEAKTAAAEAAHASSILPGHSIEPALNEEPVYRSEQDTLRMPLSSVPSYSHPPVEPEEKKTTSYNIEPPRWRH